MKGGVHDTRKRVDDSVLTRDMEKLAAGKAKELPRATSCAARKDGRSSLDASADGAQALELIALAALASSPIWL